MNSTTTATTITAIYYNTIDYTTATTTIITVLLITYCCYCHYCLYYCNCCAYRFSCRENVVPGTQHLYNTLALRSDTAAIGVCWMTARYRMKRSEAEQPATTYGSSCPVSRHPAPLLLRIFLRILLHGTASVHY